MTEEIKDKDGLIILEERVAIDQIEGDVIQGVNQVRHFDATGVHQAKVQRLSRELIESLKEAIKRGQTLDKMTLDSVKHDRRQLIVIDGHHRLQAYREAKQEGVEITEITADVVYGASPIEIRRLAIRCNHKNKLNMQSEEKTQEAWLLLWADWDKYQGMSVRAMEKDLIGVLGKRDTFSRMKKAVEHLVTNDLMLEKQLNKPHPNVPPWRHVRINKEFQGAAPEELEERKWKARVDLQGKIARLQDSAEWRLVDQNTRLDLARYLLGKDFVISPTEGE